MAPKAMPETAAHSDTSSVEDALWAEATYVFMDRRTFNRWAANGKEMTDSQISDWWERMLVDPTIVKATGAASGSVRIRVCID